MAAAARWLFGVPIGVLTIEDCDPPPAVAAGASKPDPLPAQMARSELQLVWHVIEAAHGFARVRFCQVVSEKTQILARAYFAKIQVSPFRGDIIANPHARGIASDHVNKS